MCALPAGQKSWSPTAAIVRWYRDWIRTDTATELKCSGEKQIERIARDVGVSASELRALASLRPEAADLLFSRMTALDLDRNVVAQTEAQTLHDLQRVCAMCESHRRCTRDLAHDSADPAWQDYCPNAATLLALSALPWARRREW